MTNQLPQPIKLEPTEQARLSALVARENALGKMTQDFQAAYEQRAQAVQQDMRLFWQDIAKKYGIDLNAVLYTANEDFTTLLPTQMRFGPPAANG